MCVVSVTLIIFLGLQICKFLMISHIHLEGANDIQKMSCYKNQARTRVCHTPLEKSNQSQSDMNFSLIFSFFLVGVLAFELEDIADVERG